MNRHLVVAAAVLAITGCKKNEPVMAAPIAAPAGGIPTMPPPSGMPPGAMPPPSMPPGGGAGSAPGVASALQQVVAQNPKDVQAWINLGNEYFDNFKRYGGAQTAQASIDAYEKALALQPNNPDVLTDQGVMYRDLRQYDKALANFLKANKANPNHMQSLMNAGVVYADMGDYKKAEETWLKVVATDKTGKFAPEAGAAIGGLRQRSAAPGGMPAAPPPR